MVRAIEVAREAGRKVAFTLSDTFCVDRHRDGFNAADRRAAGSTSCSPTRPRSRRWPASPHLESAVAAVAPKVETLVVTRSEDGALAIRGGERADVPAEPIEKLVDTTGAGDLFAAGFLLGDGARARASSSRCGSARSAPPR